MTPPLNEIKVVDFTELLPGPFLTQSLVELGAQVIKIERPPNGDLVRTTSPGLFNAVNRGKQSLALNLKDANDKKTALQLVKSCDILIEGYRPGVMKRLAMDYDTLSGNNKKLIYLSLSGYGQDGPLSHIPGHDLNYLAQAGITSLCGDPEGTPEHAFGLPVADLAGATYGLSALTTALFQRERTGKGQYIDLSMTDCVTHWLNARRGPLHHNNINETQAQRQQALTRPAYGVFQCKDGAITIAALEGHFWKSLVEVLNLKQFSGSEYDTLKTRTKACKEINTTLSDTLSTIPVDHALSLLLENDIPATKVLNLKEAEHSDHTNARNLMIDTSAGKLSRFPVKLNGMKEIPVKAPALNSYED